MSSPINLRAYQEALISEVKAGFYSYRRILMLSATGSGKTAMFCWMVEQAVRKGRRVVVIAHRIEIVEQIGATLMRFGVDVSWIAPGHEPRDGQVIVAMVQSLSRRVSAVQKPDFLVIDEAHHATAGTYRRIMDAWPDVYVLGASASPARTDGAGLGDCFDHMVLGPPAAELIARGYLAPFRCYAPPVVADIQSLKVRAGDFAAEQVAQVMDQRGVTGDAVKHYARMLNGRPAIAFCASVAHAEHVAQQFAEAGWKAASVDGAMHLSERQDRIRAIGDGRLNVLTSCDVISEGTDIPAVSGAILLRPTQSLIVYLQQVGRVLRPKGDGSAAVILDHVGNVVRMGMPDAPREWSLEGRAKRQAAPPVRQCPQCYAAFAPSPRCPGCQYVFPVKARRSAANNVTSGDLVQITAQDVDKRAAFLRTAPLRDLIKGAKTREALEEIRAARGYQRGWVQAMLNAKAAARAKAMGSPRWRAA